MKLTIVLIAIYRTLIEVMIKNNAFYLSLIVCTGSAEKTRYHNNLQASY
jgi:hypothetical protein